jgi:hypothetical protein
MRTLGASADFTFDDANNTLGLGWYGYFFKAITNEPPTYNRDKD